jgi:putative ABC transport system permease protein
MQWLKLSFKNVLRNRRRSFTTIMIAAVGTAGLLSAAGFGLFTYESLQELSTRDSGHVLLSHRDFHDKEEEVSMQYGLTGHQKLAKELTADMRVRAVLPRIQFSGLVTNGDKSTIFVGTGVEPQEFQIKGPFLNVLDGKILSNDAPVDGEPQVMLGKELARLMGAKVGSSLTLLSTTTGKALNAIDVRVAGIFTVGVPEMDKRLLYTSIGTAQQLLVTDKVSTLSLYLLDTSDTPVVMNDLAQRHPELARKPWWDLAFYYTAVKALYNRLFGVMGIIMAVLVFFSVSNTMSMSVVERTRETGTLAALGSYRYEQIRNFALEAFVIGVLGVLVGMAIAVSLSLALDFANVQMPPPPGRSDGYPLHILISMPLYAYVSLMVLATCVVAAFFAARRGVKKPIVEALAHV